MYKKLLILFNIFLIYQIMLIHLKDLTICFYIKNNKNYNSIINNF